MEKPKKRYSVKMHAYRLSLMLKKIERGEREIDGCCPATIQFGYTNWQPWKDTCEICRDFVGIPKRRYLRCPCFQFGTLKEAINVTTSALALYNLDKKGGKDEI